MTHEKLPTRQFWWTLPSSPEVKTRRWCQCPPKLCYNKLFVCKRRFHFSYSKFMSCVTETDMSFVSVLNVLRFWLLFLNSSQSSTCAYYGTPLTICLCSPRWLNRSWPNSTFNYVQTRLGYVLAGNWKGYLIPWNRNGISRGHRKVL